MISRTELYNYIRRKMKIPEKLPDQISLRNMELTPEIYLSKMNSKINEVIDCLHEMDGKKATQFCGNCAWKSDTENLDLCLFEPVPLCVQGPKSIPDYLIGIDCQCWKKAE